MILLFTKSPELGRVKTRLESHIGEHACLELHCFLIRKLLAEIKASGLPYQLWLDGDPQALASAIPEIAEDITVQFQNGVDLGSRLIDAIAKTLSGSDRVLIVGSDCLETTATDLLEAWQYLDRYPVVIKPAMDGGYTLLGCRKLYPEMFSGIAWGSERVLSRTLERLGEHSTQYRLLPAGRDLDTLEDLGYFAETHPEIQQLIEIER